MPYNVAALSNLRSWKPGQSGNPAGRPAVGASIREHMNLLGAMFEAGELDHAGLQAIAKRDKNSLRRAAATQLVRMSESPDHADFTDFLKGNKDLDDLKADGVDTTVIKKIKQKSRMVPAGPDGEVEEVIEREVELHDRAGSSFDRVVNHTDGCPVKRNVSIELAARDVGAGGVDYSMLTDDELAQLERLADGVRSRLQLDQKDPAPSRG